MAKKKAQSKPPPIVNIFNGDLNTLNAGSNSAKTGKKDQDLLFWAMLVHTGEATIDRKPARAIVHQLGTHTKHFQSVPTTIWHSSSTTSHDALGNATCSSLSSNANLSPNTMMLPGAPYSDLAGYLKVPQAAAPVIRMPLNVPAMKPWLQYCDNHLARSSPMQLSNLCSALEAKGFICIDQLDGPGIDVEKIISWIDVPPGVALLLYCYAKEDMALVHAGQFSMDTPVASGSQG
ncbi:hypothetical protein BJV74DRAFT_800230 [Russula compacta]|nr:hypothetical protein BJV74DRAFT_800230 [Russula compacta]